jgi:hypothetical protein
MKLKKEYGILFIVIVALSLYQILRNPDKISYRLPELPEISKGNLTKIEISKPEGPIVLSKTANGWKLLPQGYPADTDRVKNMLNIIRKLTLTTLVSESKSYDRYGLDNEKKIAVKAWQGEQLEREFDVGKTASSSRHTFVRIAGDHRVYHARQNFRSDFEQTMERLRNRNVLSFDKTEIHEIHIIQGRQSMVITRRQIPVTVTADKKEQAKETTDSETGALWQTGEGKKVDESKLNPLLSTLSNLSCDKYISGREKGEFTDPIYKILLKGTRDYSLSIFAKPDKDSENYPAVSSENNYPFELPRWKADDIMKNPDEMLVKDETSKTSK